MKRNEIKKMVEEIVKIEYIAEDGTVFDSAEECRKYEESALFTVSKKLKRLTNEWTSHYSLLENCEDCQLEIFNIETNDDLENLKRYVYLTLSKNGASESSIKECFTSSNGKRDMFVIDGITKGHEVLLFWGYDADWCWVYGDGSLNGYFNWIEDNYKKIITPKDKDEKDGDK